MWGRKFALVPPPSTSLPASVPRVYEIPSNTVWCGEASSLWQNLHAAPERRRVATAAPKFLLNASTAEADWQAIWEADISWFMACIRFGTRLELMIARIFWICIQYEGIEHYDKFVALLGYLWDQYDIESLHQLIAQMIGLLLHSF